MFATTLSLADPQELAVLFTSRCINREYPWETGILQRGMSDEGSFFPWASETLLFLLLKEAKRYPKAKRSAELHVHIEHLSYIDHACLDLLMNWARQHEGTGGKLVLDWDRLHGRFNAAPAMEARPVLAVRPRLPLAVNADSANGIEGPSVSLPVGR